MLKQTSVEHYLSAKERRKNEEEAEYDRVMQSLCRVGELVTIRSGGPTMTVMDVKPNGVLVNWFIGDEWKQAEFRFAAVKRVSG